MCQRLFSSPSIIELRTKCQKKLEGKEIWGYSKIQRRISIYFTWFWIKLNVSANHITLFNLLVVMFASLFIIERMFWLGFIFLHLFFIIDCSDGELARYYRTQSYKGLFLDRLVHIVAEPLIFLSCGFAVNNVMYGLIPAFCCQNGLRLIDWGYRISELEESTPKCARTTDKSILEKAARFFSIFGFTFILLFQNIMYLKWGLVLASFWSPIICLYYIKKLWSKDR